MTKKQYLEQILKETVDGGRVSEVERVYGCLLYTSPSPRDRG